MDLNEFTEQMETLTLAFPQAFPHDDKIRAATAAVWFKSFGHLPKEVFGKAVQHCIDHERFLTIAGIWESILKVSGVPGATEVRQELTGYAFGPKEYSTRDREETLHPMTRRILDTLGGSYDVSMMEIDPFDFAFSREYKAAKEWWQGHLRDPNNVNLLTALVTHSSELSAEELYEQLKEDDSPSRLLKA